MAVLLQSYMIWVNGHMGVENVVWSDAQINIRDWSNLEKIGLVQSPTDLLMPLSFDYARLTEVKVSTQQ